MADLTLSDLITGPAQSGGDPSPQTPPDVPANPPVSGPTPQPSFDDLREAGRQIREQGLNEQQASDTPAPVDMVRGALNAPFHLASNIGDLGADVVRTGVQAYRGNDHPEIAVPEWNPFGDTTTAVGGLTQGFTEMALGMAISGGAADAMGISDAVKGLKYGKTLLHIGEAAGADTYVFRAHDKKLSDLIEQCPALSNPVTRFLKGDESDSWFYGRLKNVLEGAGVGTLTNLAFKAVSGLKTVRAAGSMAPEAAAKVARDLQPEIDAFMSGQKDFSGVDDNTAKAIMIRAQGMDPSHADAALAALKSVAQSNGVNWTDLMKSEVLDVGRRQREVFQTASDLADKYSNGSVATGSNAESSLNRAASVITDSQNVAVSSGDPGSSTMWSFRKRLEGWLDNIRPVPATVRSVDDLKSLYTLLDRGSVADDSIAKAIAQAKVPASSLDDLLSRGVPVTAQDILNPTGNDNFGLWKRLSDAQDYPQYAEAATQAKEHLATNQKVAGEVNDLQDIGAQGREDARRQKFDSTTSTPSQIANTPITPSQLAASLPDLRLNRLWQSANDSPAVARGVTEFGNTGKAMVTMFENADPTTFVHEMAHVVRRLIPSANLEELSDKLGVADWQNWTRDDEEKFANMVSDRAVNGTSNPEIDSVFGKVQKDIANIYASLRGSSIGSNVSPSLKQFYESDRNIAVINEPTLTVTDQADLQQAGKVVADALSQGPNFSRTIDDNGINLFRVNANDSILKLEGAVSKFVEQYVSPNLTDVESRQAVLEQAQQAARDIGVTNEQFLARMSDVNDKAKGLSQSVLETKMMLHTVMSNFNDAVSAATTNRTNENALKFLQAWDHVQQAMSLYRETSSNVARGLGIFNVATGPLDNLGQLEELAKRGGSGKVWDMIDEANRINTLTPDAGRTEAVRKLMEQNKWWGLIHEFRNNSLLGNFTGLGAELASKATKTLMMPFEQALSSGISLDTDGIKDGLSFYKSLGNQLSAAWKTAAAAFRLNGPILDHTIESTPSYLRASTFGLQSGGMGSAVDWLGTIAGIPQRLRMTGDEFFKQLNYRAFMEQQFTKQAVAAGINSSDGIDRFVTQQMGNTFDQLGRGIDSNALSYARQATYATPLTEGFSAGVNRLRYQNNALSNVFRLAVPFFKVPMNIFTDVVGHTPLIGAFLKDQREAITSAIQSRDYTKASGVLGQWSTGAAAMGMASYLYHSGAITGRGSMDKATQQQMELDGWQPYSVAYTGTDGKKNYVSFNRLEPWGTLLGVMADYSELGPSLSDPDLKKSGVAAATAIARNLTNKTYIKGLTDLFDAISDPDRNMANYVQSLTGSFVPSELKAFNGDPYMREAQSTLDAFKAKTPGYSEALMPQRNILGEPIQKQQGWMLPDSVSPFAFSSSVSDPVKRELAGLGNGFKNPGPVRYGQDYRQFTNEKGQTAQDRMMELVGTMTDGDGNTLSKTLNQLIKSKDYQNLINVGDAGLPYRIKAIGQTLTRYHTAAEEKMLQEFPALAAKVHVARIQKASDLFNAVQAQQMGQTPNQ